MTRTRRFKTPGFFSRANPKEVNKELKRIQKKEGRLTAELVLQYASDPDSPLHVAFEWDDEEAAHKYRLYQARNLITNLQIVEEEDDEEYVVAPAWVRLKDDEGPHYVDVEKVNDDDDMAFIMGNAIRDLMGWVNRYEALANELPGVFDEIHKAIRKAKKAAA